MNKTWVLSVAAITFMQTAAAMAADLPIGDSVEVSSPASEWELVIAPYLWAAGLDGTVAQFGAPAVDLDVSFSDIIEHFDIGVMGVAELRNDRIGFFSDVMYVKISADANGPFGGDIDLTSSTFIASLMFEYRLAEAAEGSLDLMAGGRLVSVNSELDFSGGLLDGVSLDDGETWVDPMIGTKGRFNFTPEFYFSGWAMVGGFGVSSDINWDVFGGLGYQLSDSFSVVAGYRALGIDFQEDDFEYDVIQDGPIFGGVIRF